MLHSRKHQQGISLYIVIVIVLLSTLLALWSSRTSIFNEMIVGNDADYQRAYEAAQAMMQDAKTDIQISNSLDDCIRKPSRPCRSNDKDNKNNTNIVPMPDVSVSDLVAKLSTEETKCLNGLCLKRMDAEDFWRNPTIMGKMVDVDVGARYGQYTGATSDKTSNPILANTTSGEGAWYWIEVMKYLDEPAEDLTSTKTTPSLNARLIYRITAIARGMKPSTQVVLQSVVALDPGSGE